MITIYEKLNISAIKAKIMAVSALFGGLENFTKFVANYFVIWYNYFVKGAAYLQELRFKEESEIFYYRTGAIIIEDNHVLIIKSDAVDYLYSVGGAVNHGEAAEDAIRREVYEETGVNYEIERLVFVYENIFQENGLNFHGIEFFFLMKPRGTREGLVCKSHGMDSAKEHLHWLPLNGMDDVQLYPKFFKTRLHSLPLGIEMLKRTINDEICGSLVV
ncbi:MAG: NUDIX domain-containing protein [Firmicutes bacterium]|nr:NUDIX domain-containing protein [Bacillota bacterium]